MENKTEQQKLWSVYSNKFCQRRTTRIAWIKILITSLFAALFLLYLVITEQQQDLFIGYIGSWVCFYFIIAVIYYVLPNKEKWLIKPQSKEEIAKGTLAIIELDQGLLKELLSEKKTELFYLEKEAGINKDSEIQELLQSKTTEVDLLQETINNREVLIKKVKNLRFGSKVFLKQKDIVIID